MKNLTVMIEESSGFCFGVVNAIKMAEGQLQENEKIYSLGEIVHNEEEINRLKAKGLQIIDYDELKNIKNGKILFRAHGEPPKSFENAADNNNQIINATCPIVTKLQKRVQASYLNKENIYIYGKKNHPEVMGINGYVDNKAIVFEDLKELDFESLPKELTLYSQTTMQLEKFKETVNTLKEKGINVKTNDTVCRQVSNRHQKLIDFCKQYDKIVFIAGKHSSNGKVLFHICQTANENTYLINSLDQIDENWFSDNDKVGICGATSTPEWLLKKAETYLKEL